MNQSDKDKKPDAVVDDDDEYGDEYYEEEEEEEEVVPVKHDKFETMSSDSMSKIKRIVES